LIQNGVVELEYSAAMWHGHPGRVFTGWKPVPPARLEVLKYRGGQRAAAMSGLFILKYVYFGLNPVTNTLSDL